MHTVHQFLHVLLTADALDGAVLHEVGHDAALLHHHAAQFIGIQLGGLLDEAVHEVVETIQFGKRALVDGKVIFGRVANHGPQTHATVRCGGHNLAHGGVANAACRIVDDTLEGLLIVGIDGQTEVGDDILDLLALVERQAAIDAVGNAILA